MLLSGCVHRVVSTATHAGHYNETREDVVVRVRKLDSSESRAQFGSNLIRHGYQPLLLSIYNKSEDDIVLLRASSLDIPLARARDVALASEVPIIPVIAAPAYLSAIFLWQALLPIAGLGIWLGVHNHGVKSRIYERVLDGDKGIEILPCERITRTIFVPVDCDATHFSLHLFKVHEKSFVPFTVQLS